MATLHAGDFSSSMEKSRDRINQYLIDKGESYKVIFFFNKKSHVLGRRSAKGENGWQ